MGGCADVTCTPWKLLNVRGDPPHYCHMAARKPGVTCYTPLVHHLRGVPRSPPGQTFQIMFTNYKLLICNSLFMLCRFLAIDTVSQLQRLPLLKRIVLANWLCLEHMREHRTNLRRKWIHRISIWYFSRSLAKFLCFCSSHMPLTLKVPILKLFMFLFINLIFNARNYS